SRAARAAVPPSRVASCNTPAGNGRARGPENAPPVRDRREWGVEGGRCAPWTRAAANANARPPLRAPGAIRIQLFRRSRRAPRCQIPIQLHARIFDDVHGGVRDRMAKLRRGEFMLRPPE